LMPISPIRYGLLSLIFIIYFLCFYIIKLIY